MKSIVTQAIIYVNKRRRVEWLADQLRKNNHTVSLIHGEISHQEREGIMHSFRNGSTRILVQPIYWPVVLMFNKYHW